ncbi:MAG: pyruvate kinase [Fimbriimonadaceae bacterium]
MGRRTKIVCTLGPAVSSETKIKALIRAGMNVARINCSHGDWETRKQWIDWIRKHSPTLAPIGILADLQGPKFRLGMIEGGELEIRAGRTVEIGPTAIVPITQEQILAAMSVGDRLLLGDGDVELKLTAKVGENFTARAISGGKVKTKQGVTLVGKVFKTSCLTPKDIEDATQAAGLGVDFIALSYVHEAADMEQLRDLLRPINPHIKLCAKIETRDAVNHIAALAAVSDVIMVARGDMGLQMDIEDVPLAQKRVIRAAQDAGKPVITATQMLESMTHAPRPTRAEATDVANAILDGTDAVMLSGETASGDYPLEAVRYMGRIAKKAESVFNHERWMEDHVIGPSDETLAVSCAVADLAAALRPKAILTTTTSGQTARLISKFRPASPILCATWSQYTYRQLSVVWGVESLFMPLPSTTDEQIYNAIARFVEVKRLKVGDNVVVSAGVPAGRPGNTNLILIQKVEPQG